MQILGGKVAPEPGPLPQPAAKCETPWEKSPSRWDLKRGWFGEGMVDGARRGAQRGWFSSSWPQRGSQRSWFAAFSPQRGSAKFRHRFAPTGFGPQGVEGPQSPHRSPSPCQLAASSKKEPPEPPPAAGRGTDAQLPLREVMLGGCTGDIGFVSPLGGQRVISKP